MERDDDVGRWVGWDGRGSGGTGGVRVATEAVGREEEMARRLISLHPFPVLSLTPGRGLEGPHAQPNRPCGRKK